MKEQLKEGRQVYIQSEDILGDKVIAAKIIKIGSKTFLVKPDYYKVTLPVGAKFEIYYLNGTNKYYFTSEVVPVKFDDVIRFYTPKVIEKSLLREFARVPVSIKAKVKARNTDNVFEAEITNLSGNGMTLNSNGSFSENSDILITFFLTLHAKAFNVIGDVIRVEILFKKEDIYKYRIAVTYKTMDDQDHKELLQYIHSKQVNLV